MTVTIVVDLLYPLIDPRTRERSERDDDRDRSRPRRRAAQEPRVGLLPVPRHPRRRGARGGVGAAGSRRTTPTRRASTTIWLPPGPAHWLGTDQLGRDLLSRIIPARARRLLGSIALLALATALGVLIGLTAAWHRGWVDTVLARVTDVMFAFPGLLFVVLIIAVFDSGTVTAVVGMGLAYAPVIAKFTRAIALEELARPYVDSYRLQGVGGPALCARYVLPNMLPTLLGYLVVLFGEGLMSLATLNFLGFGSQPPSSDWGLMVEEGRAGVIQGDPRPRPRAGTDHRRRRGGDQRGRRPALRQARGPEVDAVVLAIRDLSLTVPMPDGPRQILRDVSLDGRAGGDRRAGRRVRVGQVDDRARGAAAASRPARARPARSPSAASSRTRRTPAACREIRTRHAAMIFQDPRSSLNPVRRIGDSATERLVHVHGVAKAEAARPARRPDGRGRPARPGAAAAQVPAPALRRDAAARGHRRRTEHEPRAAARRRGDQRAGRDDPGRGARAAAQAAAGAGDGRPVHHPRPAARRRLLRPRLRHEGRLDRRRADPAGPCSSTRPTRTRRRWRTRRRGCRSRTGAVATG